MQASRHTRLLAALFFTVAGTSGAAEPAGSLLEAYERLQSSACVPEDFGVATPIEARVLRNLPYARAGLRFAAAELGALYASDGDWYRPARDRVLLSDVDAACVARLQRHERRLRAQLPIAPAVEAVLIADLAVFQGLRGGLRYPNQYREAWSRVEPGRWSWGFVDGGACGGDGSPEAAGDCAGLTVICEREAEAEAPRCELIWSG